MILKFDKLTIFVTVFHSQDLHIEEYKLKIYNEKHL